MISFLRRIIGSKGGGVFAVLFLLVIAIGFIISDIERKESNSSFSIFGTPPAAKVGGESLTETDLQARIQRVFEQQRRETPGLQIDQFLQSGAVLGLYNQLVASLAFNAFADDQGVHVSKRMVDARIAEIPAFHDAAGQFSPAAFRQLLAAQGLSEKALRDDIAQEQTVRLIATPATLGAVLPDGLVAPYASLLLESRQGRIIAVPATAFAPPGAPADSVLQAYYRTNIARFTIPERRRLRYAVIDGSRFAAAATPSAAEIAAAYNQNKAQYAAHERRSIEQLILPTEAAAKAAVGKPLAVAAKDAGLEVAKFDKLDRTDLARQTSDAVAQAAFAAAQGGNAGPVKSAFGWALIHVTAVEKIPETTLAQATPKITETLKAQKQAQLLGDFVGKLEDQAAGGATFDEVAKDNGLSIETSPAIVANGRNPDDQAFKPSADLGPLIKAGFDMEADDEPQLVPIVQQSRYALLDVADIVPPTPAPFDKIRPAVAERYRQSEGAKRARDAATALRTRIAGGTPLEQAVAQAGAPLPAVQTVNGRRADLLQQQKGPAPQLALLFAMPAGSVKVLPMPSGAGYYVVRLDKIEAADPAKTKGVIQSIRPNFAQVAGNEYGSQLEQAIERYLNVKRNGAALTRVNQQLRRINGGNGAQ